MKCFRRNPLRFSVVIEVCDPTRLSSRLKQHRKGPSFREYNISQSLIAQKRGKYHKHTRFCSLKAAIINSETNFGRLLIHEVAECCIFSPALATLAGSGLCFLFNIVSVTFRLEIRLCSARLMH